MSYNPFKGNIYVLLKDQAKSDDVLKAAFHVRHLTYPSDEHETLKN